MKNKNGFDRIAWFYDRLAFVCSAGAIYKCRVANLDLVPSGARILFIGGGTGKEISVLAERGFTGKIDYIDLSEEMIRIARSDSEKLNPFQKPQINFICADFKTIQLTDGYDIILTNFFLDLFKESEIREFYDKLSLVLKPGGLWLISDFSEKPRNVAGQIFSDIILKFLYFIFFLVCGISGRKLTPPSEIISSTDFELIKSENYFFGLLKADVWKKTL